jgi:membrane protein DedA with SNARE-associated domain
LQPQIDREADSDTYLNHPRRFGLMVVLWINIIGALCDLVISIIARVGYVSVLVGTNLESVGVPLPHEVIGALSNLAISIIAQLGYAGVLVGMTLESVGVPLPSEVIMPFAGYVVWTGGMTLIGVSLAGTAGCLVGSLIAYYISLWGGRPLLDRYGKYILIRKRELDLAQKWFEKYGDRVVFVSRLLPVARTFISYPAGIARMDVKKFSLYTVLGSFPFCFALASVGVILGPHWADIERSFVYLDVLVIAGTVGLAAYLVYHRQRVLSYIRAS